MAPEMMDTAVLSSPMLMDHIAESPSREIVKTPGICGGHARIQGTRITVRGVEEARRHGIIDAVILEMYPSITAADVHSAWNYVASHQEEIDDAIFSNNNA